LIRGEIKIKRFPRRVQFWDARRKKQVTLTIKSLNDPAHPGNFEYLLDDGGTPLTIGDLLLAEEEETEEEEDGYDPYITERLLFNLRNKLIGLESLIAYFRFFRNFTHKKIAQYIGCSQSYVFVRIHRIERIIEENEECKELWEEMIGKKKKGG